MIGIKICIDQFLFYMANHITIGVLGVGSISFSSHTSKEGSFFFFLNLFLVLFDRVNIRTIYGDVCFCMQK